ncbi:PREDICTED: non-homologous end-joining factor 1 isoform X3 [Pseudopodoces humilis]|uniref:non-homologous end-joining factor 1 isoform X3 n=1 Tax=Pseudopodoces humilis TaxID=181119 RepID=UPI0006B87A22|nr:PREDICTED: non-homologous end-joining factor 1 isoform X3 [Pseudopodoces humilis]
MPGAVVCPRLRPGAPRKPVPLHPPAAYSSCPRVFRHLVRPLIQMNLVLQCQVQELISLVLQKDAEIEDYRESGAALSRDRLRTKPFQEETFQQNFMAETLPQICGAGEGQAFASALQQLYTAVTQQEAKQARKRHCSDCIFFWYQRTAWIQHPLQKPRSTPIHLLHPRKMKQHLPAREPRQPPPHLRSPSCLQPRPSQRRQKGSSAERLLRALLPPASKRWSAEHPRIVCLFSASPGGPYPGHGPLPRCLQLGRWNSFLQQCFRKQLF